MGNRVIRLGHSPDSDDAFMFYALATGAIETGDFKFEHVLRDIQTLNDWAQEGKLEVTAVSVHAYAYLQDRYAVLSSGASMAGVQLTQYVPDPNVPQEQVSMPKLPAGGAHGPLVVARRDMPEQQLSSCRIGVPGRLTTAYLALQMAIGPFDCQMMNFDDIIPAVVAGQVDAGLIIHEGQLSYQEHGLTCLMDLGQWWFQQTNLPLPLGCNLVRRDLGVQAMRQISRILKESIRYSLTHRAEALDYALQFGRGLDAESTGRFVGMYVNDWTLDYGPVGREAMQQLLQRAAAEKLTPPVPQIDFV